jgi:hypothetical protein
LPQNAPVQSAATENANHPAGGERRSIATDCSADLGDIKFGYSDGFPNLTTKEHKKTNLHPAGFNKDPIDLRYQVTGEKTGRWIRAVDGEPI